MRILLATHGFTPEQGGGVELHTQELAFELARTGHQVFVVAGTLAPVASPGVLEVRREVVQQGDGPRIEVARIARGDLYFDHWHKSHSADASRAFRGLLREFRPDVVHVQHWIRLSRDLVTVAAREKIPSVVTLHDSWASCPIVFRVRPDTLAACDAPVGAHPCISCAGRVPPRTPWVPIESSFMLLSERQRDIARELVLARAVITPSRAHARALERWLGRASDSLEVHVIPPCVGTLAVKRAEPRAPLQRRFVVSTWSQIARHKGLDLLTAAVRAAGEQLRGEIELGCEIFGAEADPKFAAELRASAPIVRLDGAWPPQLDRDARLFVSSSRVHESYGVTADEAARAGLALLLPDAPAFVERLSGVAEFYAGGSVQALTEQIVRLARDPSLVERARGAAGAYASRLVSNSTLAERHLTLYQDAISEGAPAVAAESWFDARMAQQATLEWDRALSLRSRAELGL